MLTTKDARGFLAPLAEVTASVHAVPVPDEPLGQDPVAIATHARALGVAAETATSVRMAVAAILARRRGPARILVCGSLYLAGHVLRDHG
jgi:dihydrofolate synthase / folylpolyglutamate synthase